MKVVVRMTGKALKGDFITLLLPKFNHSDPEFWDFQNPTH